MSLMASACWRRMWWSIAVDEENLVLMDVTISYGVESELISSFAETAEGRLVIIARRTRPLC